MTTPAKSAIIILIVILSAATVPLRITTDTLGNHECFVSITAREMLQNGNWLIPTCNNKPRFKKTPLSYWLVASLAEVTGQVDEITARLPSVIFGILSVVAIIYFVSRWLSFRIAALSAGVWATCLGYLRYSVSARPEMALTFFVMLCFLSFYSAVESSNRKRQVVYIFIFWLSFGLGMLAKGPAPIPYVLLPLFCYIAVFRKWRVIPKLLPVAGPILFLAIVLPWPLFIAGKMNWDLTVWKHEFVDRLFGTYRSGNKPVYYYLYIMFQFIIPWVAFLPMALAGPFYRIWGRKRRTMMFLWMWFVVDLLFLTIDEGKRQHYILPLLPAMAILIGILLEDMVFSREAYTLKFAADVLRNHIVAIVICVIAGVFYIAKVYPDMLISTIILGTIVLALIAVVGVLFVKGKPAIACAILFAGIVTVINIFYIRIAPLLDYNRYSRDFSKKVAEIVPPCGQLVGYEGVSNRFVQYFGRVVPEIKEASELLKHYQNGDWVVATGNSLKKLEKNETFRQIYYKEKAERYGHKDVSGALFHKINSALHEKKEGPVIEDQKKKHFR